MFEKAARKKLRFTTSVGRVSVEDLFDMKLETLDDLYMSLAKQIQGNGIESLIKKQTKTNEMLQLSFDIVKHIIEVRLAENEASSLALANKAQRNIILGLIAEKKNESLKQSSIEELEAQLAKL